MGAAVGPFKLKRASEMPSKFIVSLLIISLQWVIAAGAEQLNSSSPSSTIKCLYCARHDYLPAWAESRLLHSEDFNSSYSHSYLPIDFLARNCRDRQRSYCQSGSHCAKRTVTYQLQEGDQLYTFNSYLRVCTSERLDGPSAGVAGAPGSGECRMESTLLSDYDQNNDTSLFVAKGISLNASWCYCNDEDFCNGVHPSVNHIQLAIMTLIGMSLLHLHLHLELVITS